MKQIQKLREEFNNKLDKLEAKLVKKKWTKIGNLEWSEPLGEMNWHDAKKKCEEMGGRLPTRIELLDLVDNHSDEIEDWDTDVYFWSATTLSIETHYAWNTNLGYGYTYYNRKTSTYDSRCIR